MRRVIWFGFLAGVVAGCPARAGDCYFSQVRWRAEGVEFVAGSAAETRTLLVDPATGRVHCLDPRVREPLMASGRVVFTDLFGVFEFDPASRARPRQVLFMPSSGSTFVRAAGADTRGRTLVWTYDRDRAEHIFWNAAGTGFDRIVQPNGPAALGAWRTRNVATAFATATTRFVRSTCLRRPHGEERLCIESVAGTDRWRLTLGPPNEVVVLTPDCTPVAFAAIADSSLALVEVIEPGAGAGSGPALVTWLARWSEGARRVTRVAPPPSTANASWFHREAGTSVLWADASGTLWRIPLEGGEATVLVEAPLQKRHAEVFRVVLAVTERRERADSLQARLAAGGIEARIATRGGLHEVQSGAYGERGPAQARIAALRQRGFAGARVESGDARSLAPGVEFAHATGTSGRTAWVRRVERRDGVYTELWGQTPGEASRLLVPSLETGMPAGSP